jgi:hypothetical protein
LLAGGMISLSSSAQSTNLLEADFKIPLWYDVLSFRGSGGYKDNVLLSETNTIGSPFASCGGGLMVYRLPTSGWLFNFLASADYTRYFSSAVSTSDETAAAAAQATRNLGNGFSSGFGLNYLFQHQVLDLTALATNGVGEVIGHNFTGRWFARKDFKTGWIEADTSGTRQLLAAPLDGFWQFGPKIVLGRHLSPASDLTLSYQWNYVMFDARQDVTAQGSALPGTSLRMENQVAELAWSRSWDAKARWNTSVSAGFESSQDNGSGYFNYYLYRVAPKFEYRAATWKISALCRLGAYEYPVETTSPSSSTLLGRSYLSAALHAEKNLSKKLKLFADYLYDSSYSNVDTLRYGANTASLGLSWQL